VRAKFSRQGWTTFEYANAFLLRMDIGVIATDEEVEILNAFFGAQAVARLIIRPGGIRAKDSS
jgi:hypothetical protein